jgi:hypothetical protein
MPAGIHGYPQASLYLPGRLESVKQYKTTWPIQAYCATLEISPEYALSSPVLS